jgi:hypothetical protein
MVPAPATRLVLTVLGTAAIVAYAAWGCVLMNDWAVVAASELPLDRTIRDMTAAGQRYTTLPGTIFAAVGGLLALTWGALVLHPRFATPAWAALSLWTAILAFGAPAYFFASFGNLNSVGDTYVDWNGVAASGREHPLYLVSGFAGLAACATLLAKARRSLAGHR